MTTLIIGTARHNLARLFDLAFAFARELALLDEITQELSGFDSRRDIGHQPQPKRNDR